MRRVTSTTQLHQLAEQIGNFIEYWGFKKIHGMIWTLLYLSPDPLSAQELIARLKVSKALISLSMKDLIHYQLILQTNDSVNRKNKFYTANSDIFTAIRGVLEAREMKMMERIQKEFDFLSLLQKETKTLGQLDEPRLASLGQMIGGANEGLQSLIHLSKVDPSFLDTMFKK